jgi:hypothetical protein
MATARTTIRIDGDLLQELRDRAHRDNISITRLVNQAIRRGLSAPAPRRPRRFRQRVTRMGKPLVNLDKALAFADELEDQEIIRKLALGK